MVGKVAPFDRYATLDVVRAVAASSRAHEVALYTGNDDNIVVDLLTPYRVVVDVRAASRQPAPADEPEERLGRLARRPLHQLHSLHLTDSGGERADGRHVLVPHEVGEGSDIRVLRQFDLGDEQH